LHPGCDNAGEDIFMIETNGGMSHIHLWVSDMERSVQFYERVFGMRERFRSGKGLVSLNTPGTSDSVSLNWDPADKRPKGQMGTVAHFGFRLKNPEDLDRAIEEAIAAGGRVVERGDRGGGKRFAYVTDPDGYLIEL
jgi:catechol 2,3-dioxygenase-like lactoylglutathione lyase family enzyme